jgi:hypothetical protein
MMDELLLENEKEWRRYLVAKIDHLEEEVIGLRIKASIWGATAGLVAALAVLVISKFKG